MKNRGGVGDDVCPFRRRFDPFHRELMDEAGEADPCLAEDLRNLERFNRWFGGYRVVEYFLDHLDPGRDIFRVLDLGTGFGDVPRWMVAWGRQRGVRVQATAVDRQEPILDLARGASTSFPEIHFVQGDLLTFQPKGEYDLVISSLVLHHFSNEDACRILERIRGIPAHLAVVIDLDRGWFTSLGIWLVTQFWLTAPMTRHDARLSARHAFSLREMASLARESGWRSWKQRRFFPARQALWMMG